MTVENSPLQSSDPDAISALFRADPMDLTDADLDSLISELRRRRNAHLSEEAAKQAKGKSARAPSSPAPSAPKAAALDVPTAELSLDDLLGGAGQ